MFITVITWNGCEIGYGIGQSARFSQREAIDSVASIYGEVRREWMVATRKEAA